MENKDMQDSPSKPVSIEILDVHLDYMRKDIEEVLRGMSNMATKGDVEKLSARMDKFVTTDRFDALEKKVEAGTIVSTFGRVMKTIQSLAVTATALAALFGMVYAVVHYIDKIKTAI